MNSRDVQLRGDTIGRIQGAVADLFGLSEEELRQKSTRRAVTVPRQIAMYLAKQMTDASLPEIGHYFGDKHHTTVMYAIAKIEEQRGTDGDLDQVIGKLLKTLSRSHLPKVTIP
jgi:chromosomal replication initiator protein